MSRKVHVLEDPVAFRAKIADAIRFAKEPISVRGIRKVINYVPTKDEPNPSYHITAAVNYMKERGWLSWEGVNHGMKYWFNDTYHDELNPLNKLAPATLHARANGTAAAKTATLHPVAMVQIPRASLKLLVRNVMDNNEAMEGELQRAVMQAVALVL